MNHSLNTGNNHSQSQCALTMTEQNLTLYLFLFFAVLKGNYTGDCKLLKFLLGTFMWNHEGNAGDTDAITHHYHCRLMAVPSLCS